MSKKIQTTWEAIQSETFPKSNTYEKQNLDHDNVIIVYDSQGRMLEVKSVYGAFANSPESEEYKND